MSDDFHRPTYTTRDVHGAFNATQVRLYGVPGLPRLRDKKEGLAKVVAGVYKQYTLFLAEIKKLPSDDGGDDEVILMLKKIFADQIERNLSSFIFINSIMKNYLLMIGSIDVASPDEEEKYPFTSGTIFGYSYEGHTYDLPKPKIMLIPALPEKKIPDDDSGYDLKEEEGYAVWIVDKLDQCIEIDINQGFVEQLVLEANLPGKRAPSMYAAKMMMGHRSGRLTE